MISAIQVSKFYCCCTVQQP